MRASSEIRAEYDAANQEYSALGGRVSSLRKELEQALVSEAAESAGPMVGKLVTKQQTHGYRGKTVKRVGTVTIYDPAKHRGLRGVYLMKPGELFVLNASGITGYKWREYGEQEPSWTEIALAAGTRRAETGETPARAEGCQSGPNEDSGNAHPSEPPRHP